MNYLKFLSAFILACVALVPLKCARADPLDCAAVDALAQLYVRPEALISINIIGDSDRKVCYFSIDGATSEAALNAQPSIDRGIQYLAQMKKMAEGGLEAYQVKATAQEFLDYLPYLLSSGRLENEKPPEIVAQAVKQNAGALSDCFASFYGRSPVKFSGDNVSCETLAKPENVLLVGINGRTSYNLYTFR